jgi:hypothetical protein
MKEAKKPTKAPQVSVAALKEELNRIGVALSAEKLKSRQLEIANARLHKALRKQEHVLLTNMTQQSAIKDFRTGQATVLLATVNMLEEALRSYADEESWTTSNADNPVKDRFIGTRVEVTRDGDSVNIVNVPTSGPEIAQAALDHELTKVG